MTANHALLTTLHSQSPDDVKQISELKDALEAETARYKKVMALLDENG